MFSATKFPRRIDRQSDGGAEPVRRPDRTRHRLSTAMPCSTSRPISTLYLGQLEQRSRMRRASVSSCRTAGGMTASLHAQLRPSLGQPAALHPRTTCYSTGALEDVWGVSGVGNLFKPGVLPGARPQFVQYDDRRGGVQAPTGTTSRRTSASPGVRLRGSGWRQSARQGRRHGAPGRVLTRRSTGAACPTTPASSAPTPARRSRRTATPTLGNLGHVAAALPRDEPARPRSVPGEPVVPA